jgi:hypothetical protein
VKGKREKERKKERREARVHINRVKDDFTTMIILMFQILINHRKSKKEKSKRGEREE